MSVRGENPRHTTRKRRGSSRYTHPFTRSSPLATAGSRLILTVVLSLVSSLHSSRSAYASRPLRGERRESEADDVKGGGNQGLTAYNNKSYDKCLSLVTHLSLPPGDGVTRSGP